MKRWPVAEPSAYCQIEWPIEKIDLACTAKGWFVGSSVRSWAPWAQLCRLALAAKPFNRPENWIGGFGGHW
jgi:hypothetical protein